MTATQFITPVATGWKCLRNAPEKHIGQSMRGRKTDWILPRDGTKPAWMPGIDDVTAGRSGYHFCDTRGDLLDHLGPIIVSVSAAGRIDSNNGIKAATTMRLETILDAWNDVSARLFAVACASSVLHKIDSIELQQLSLHAIETGRHFAHGKARMAEIDAAIGDLRDARKDLSWGPLLAAIRACGFCCSTVGGWYAAEYASRYADFAASGTLRKTQKQRLAHLLNHGQLPH